MNSDLSTLPVGILVALGILVVAALVLDAIALIDLYRRPVELVTFGNKWIWLGLVLVLNMLGPVLYLVIGRKTAAPLEASVSLRSQSKPNGAADAVEKLYGPREHPDQH